ncbi:MAG: CvpA family protein [Oscillibacter sp.]|nr:CvpA family protein [Oscillibacter sp.]
MADAVIMDGITAVWLLFSAVRGGRRGFVRSIAGLAAVLAALVGAGIIAGAAAPYATKYVQPLIEKRVEARMDAALSGGAEKENSSASAEDPAAQTPDGDAPVESVRPPVSGGEESGAPTGGDAAAGDGAEWLLHLLKVDGDPARSLAESARERVRETGVSMLTAVTQSVAQSVIRALLLVLSFLALLAVCHLVLRALDLAARLPGLNFLNRLGGAALGLAQGALAVFLAIWVLRRLGVSFDTSGAADTCLLSIFTTHTPLDVLSFL